MEGIEVPDMIQEKILKLLADLKALQQPKQPEAQTERMV